MGEERPEAGGAWKKSGMMPLIIVGVVVLMAAVLGLAVFRFVLQPMLTSEPEQPDGDVPGAFYVDFDELQVTGQPNDPNEVAPILAFSITLACRNAETIQLIETNRPRFEGLLVDLYGSKTHRQLSDPFEKTQIQQEALRLINALLKEYRSEVDLAVTEVLHRRYALVEQ